LLYAGIHDGAIRVNSFSLRLNDSTRVESISDVELFVGEDRTGSFGILAGHARFMTSLSFGLARLRIRHRGWRYLALPGALLYFRNNELTLCTRHYLIDEDFTRISAGLTEQLRAEEDQLMAVKLSLRRMEEETLRRLWRLGRA
jgi:F-type H+-transporting ATPase subunit epsilon